MKRRFKMVDLDCANCAAKMERSINKIEGVHEASISYMTQKLIIDAEESNFDEIMQEVARACSRVDANCKIQF